MDRHVDFHNPSDERILPNIGRFATSNLGFMA
ncbi:hypothetical protein ABENE_10330 [Asticcacaulis benevestitus DSM 16100 = ATCC BAA-896]|uniref:Uncharacterized protein n=1 Tax=Asticcacaulis benevestitus DSM 16100 = ATCC BAA-896 TaxID=1121022 RepID=V4PST5_9CAUL|nr:hypothetical protein ABENE_10330 [Asticcacaulis benevestitus DSM 16100 = ATCC BAA-896]